MSVDKLSEKFQKLSARNIPGGDRLIIALDFGTTFSGVAYAFTNDPEKVYTVDSWPGGDDRIVPKTPTTLLYENGSKDKFQWGYQLDQTLEEKIVGLKLLLDPDQKRPYWIPTNVEAEMAKLPKDVLDVASDYIRVIFEHALKEIEKGYLPDFIRNFAKQYVLTVPAVWSDKAKDMTLRAARNAGISPVDMITEPEAAALFTLQSMKDKGLKDGDAIVICDAGGGTVDLVAYEITSLYPFEVKAMTSPSGGAHGSLMLNRTFEEEVRKTVGEDAYPGLKRTEAYRSALREFDVAIKLSFRGKSDPDRYVSFPMAKLQDNKSRGLIKNSMTLSGSTLFRIFDPIISEIDKLVTDQVRNVQVQRLKNTDPNGASVKAIFLVGGFGASAYLKERIIKSHPDIMIIQPKEAWSAIVKGAAMSKLPLGPLIPKVLSTRSAKHYGTSCNSTWDSFRDRGFPKLKDEWKEDWRCEIMQWFIYKEDELVRDKKKSLSFFRGFTGHNPSKADLQIVDQLYESGSILAPDHPGDDVKSNVTLNTDLSKVPKKHFRKLNRDSDGAPYSQLDYNLQIENGQSGLMKFSIEVDGKLYAAVDASY
ncbi:hypothetical protein BJ170DRAFT_684939 [Xylariales sp. AK1849]|nr:hypothetical protein BJ170DRAFT_684939 [Xylariales sp. AK1849]